MDPHVTRCDFYDGRKNGLFQNCFYNVHSFEIMFALPASAHHSHVIDFMLKRLWRLQDERRDEGERRPVP